MRLMKLLMMTVGVYISSTMFCWHRKNKQFSGHVGIRRKPGKKQNEITQTKFHFFFFQPRTFAGIFSLCIYLTSYNFLALILHSGEIIFIPCTNTRTQQTTISPINNNNNCSNKICYFYTSQTLASAHTLFTIFFSFQRK